jgi:hypothetical protein
MSVAFGQKGRWEMRVFEIPMWVTSLFGLCLLSSLEAPAAHADFTFGTPTNLGPGVNSQLLDAGAWVSADGLSVFFGRWANWSASPEAFLATRPTEQDRWGDAVSLGAWGPACALLFLRSVGSAPGVTTADGLEAYFAFTESEQPGGYGHYDLWATKRQTTNADWGALANLGPLVNSSADETMPTVSADGLELHFSEYTVPRPGGYGNSDIWVTKRATRNAPWTAPVNLGPVVNSASYDSRPRLSADGLSLFFDSQRPGGYGQADLYVTKRASATSPWGLAVNLGPVVNSPAFEECAFPSADGTTLYWDSGRPGGYGGHDIWQAPIIPIVDFNGDGKVDGQEVLAIADHWGQNEVPYDIGPTALGDGVVDVNDLIVLADYIGTEWVDPTLLAHWPLDEGAGSVALDRVGGHDAMIVGSVVWQADGKVGGALAFDGNGNFMRTVRPVLDPGAGPFSLLAWVKGGAPNKVIASQFGAADWLYLNQYGMLTTDLKSSGKGGESLTSDAYVLDEQWHRVVLTCDDTNRTLQMDGVEVARDTQPSLSASNGSLQIGCGKSATPTTFWTGLIDEVRVYRRAVSP